MVVDETMGRRAVFADREGLVSTLAALEEEAAA